MLNNENEIGENIVFLKNYESFLMETLQVLNNMANLLGKGVVFNIENENLSDFVAFICMCWDMISDKPQAVNILRKRYASLSLTHLKDINVKFQTF